MVFEVFIHLHLDERSLCGPSKTNHRLGWCKNYLGRSKFVQELVYRSEFSHHGSSIPKILNSSGML